MELDDMLLRGAEVRNDRLRLLDDISGLKRVQSHLTSEMSIQDQVLRDAEGKFKNKRIDLMLQLLYISI